MLNQIKYTVKLTVVLLIFSVGCNYSGYENARPIDKVPEIFPDYSQIVIPFNIAPLNFKIKDEAEKFYVSIESPNEIINIQSQNGKVLIPDKEWKRLLQDAKGDSIIYTITQFKNGEWQRYRTFSNQVSKDEIDSYLFYRLLYPGYELWNEMGIYGRDLTCFEETALIENKSIQKNCVNCHTFNQNSPNTFLFHIRGERGGTILSKDGAVSKLNTKTKGMLSAGVYSAWHPRGRYVAFSTNKIQQFFHAQGDKLIDVSDFASNLVILDTETNQVFSDSTLQSSDYMETFPNWSPDGKYLYFTRAKERKDSTNYNNIRYDLMRIEFNTADKSFGQTEVVYAASENRKSVTFPKVSPNNRYVMFTLSDYGTFSIWHKEADLFMMNLQTKAITKLPVNSDDVESYHSWSSSGSWFVFSSKRLDGQCARPYFAHISENGSVSKPFVLPQKDPEFYDSYLKTYNIPQLVKGPFDFDTWKLVRESAFKAKKVKGLVIK